MGSIGNEIKNIEYIIDESKNFHSNLYEIKIQQPENIPDSTKKLNKAGYEEILDITT